MALFRNDFLHQVYFVEQDRLQLEVALKEERGSQFSESLTALTRHLARLGLLQCLAPRRDW